MNQGGYFLIKERKNMLSVLNIPIQIGDLVCSVRNPNGIIETVKGVVTKLNEETAKATILGIDGVRYLYGKASQLLPANAQYIVSRSIYGRMLIQVKDLAHNDPDFELLFKSDKYKNLKL